MGVCNLNKVVPLRSSSKVCKFYMLGSMFSMTQLTKILVIVLLGCVTVSVADPPLCESCQRSKDAGNERSEPCDECEALAYEQLQERMGQAKQTKYKGQG